MYATDVLTSGQLGYGSYISQFEKMVASAVGRRYGVAVSSGTAALHMALVAAGVEPGDRVIVPDLTFIATANAVRYVGAWPIFMDVDNGWQMDLDILRVFILDQCRWERGALYTPGSYSFYRYRIKAVVVVPLLGNPLDLGDLPELLEERGVALIEDAAQSLGGYYRGFASGNNGVAGTFSFNVNKVVTAAGGGMVVTDDEQLAWLVRHFSDQARNRDHPDEYMHTGVGYNYRMSNLQAAIGVAQMEKLEEHLQQKRSIASRYMHGFGPLPGIASYPCTKGGMYSDVMSTHWLNAMRLDRDSRPLIRFLREKGIEASAIYQPLHMSRAYAHSDHIGGSKADQIWREAICLPSGAGLKLEQVDEVGAAVVEFLDREGD